MRTDRYRYISWGGDRAANNSTTYDTDPREFMNLVADPQHADVLEFMRSSLAKGSCLTAGVTNLLQQRVQGRAVAKRPANGFAE